MMSIFKKAKIPASSTTTIRTLDAREVGKISGGDTHSCAPVHVCNGTSCVDANGACVHAK